MYQSNSKLRASIQAFGGFLTGMIIPNMGAFIAWGFITALFIPTGWMPNESFGSIVGPMIVYLLPLLIAYTGGRMVHDTRGGVAGTVGTIGLIVGSDIPMFLGAMVMGPLSAWIIKKFDKLIVKRIPTGFEMVINNFSLGIIGLCLCLLSYAFIGPVILSANNGLTFMIEALMSTGFLPILSLLNEPAKVLFLNNVIDQGIYYPLGMIEALETGQSILFMVASNPGSGLGMLLAYTAFSKGASQKTAPGAIIIHFLGGIHEIYYPYVFMKPIMIVAMILGGASGTFVFGLTGVGLVAGPSPGSIFAYLALTPQGNHFGVIAGVFVAAAVSFLVASLILKVTKPPIESSFSESQTAAKNMKREGKDMLSEVLDTDQYGVAVVGTKINSVAFACDAGLGSSAMSASAFRKKLKQAGISVEVNNYAIEKVPANTDVIIVHKNLLERALRACPNTRIITIENFLSDTNIDELYNEIASQQRDGE